MKYQTTARAIKEGYCVIVRAGYCSLQNLLAHESPVAYARGVYGWNFDVYAFGGFAIATGYRGMPSKNAREDYDLIREYEEKAQGKSTEEKRALIMEFINKSKTI